MQNGAQPGLELTVQNIVAVLGAVCTDYNRLWIQAAQDELSLTIKQRLVSLHNALAAQLQAQEQAANKPPPPIKEKATEGKAAEGAPDIPATA